MPNEPNLLTPNLSGNDSSTPDLPPSDSSLREKITVLGILALVSAVLIVYSQTRAFVWDEGFHLIAASLIAAGKSPYIDFCFPQTPLNAYWNALLLRVFGQSWQMPQLFAALFISVSAGLAAEFVWSRFPVRRWRAACAACTAVFIGLNTVVLQFGPIAQAYGICMFLGTLAFRSAVAAVGRARLPLTLLCGLSAGAAAASSLLTAPLVPVLLVWIWFYNRAGNRWTKSAAFLVSAFIPFIPVVRLFLKGPRQVLFNIVQYQAIYRRVDWPGATLHDVTTLSQWTISTQGLALALLGVAGILYIRQQPYLLDEGQPSESWDRVRRTEFYLAGWLAAAMSLFIATAHPTFERYFSVMVPFAGIMAAVGFWGVGSRLAGANRPWAAASLTIALTAFALGRTELDDLDATTWKDYNDISQKVASVTPPNATLYADEIVYFTLRRTPPEGMEFSYSHKLDLPHDQEALFHLLSEKEIKEQLQQGRFDTVQSCKDDLIEKYKLSDLYSKHADVLDCTIFWDKKNRPK